MKKTRIITTVVLLLAMSTVAFAIFKETGRNVTFYYEVDEVDPEKVSDQTFKLSGIVQKDSIVRVPEKTLTTFIVEGKEKRYQVTYTGALPDIFRDGIQVVVTGSFTNDGVFQSHELMAKCPSKYDTKDNPADFAHLYDEEKMTPAPQE